jgi:hypothetical protein
LRFVEHESSNLNVILLLNAALNCIVIGHREITVTGHYETAALNGNFV